MVIESVRIAVRQTKREELRRAFNALLGPTQAEPGCMSCRILQEGNDSRAFCYEARWKSKEDLLRHVRAARYKRLLALMDLGDEPPLIEFHTIADTKGLDLIQSARNLL